MKKKAAKEGSAAQPPRTGPGPDRELPGSGLFSACQDASVLASPPSLPAPEGTAARPPRTGPDPSRRMPGSGLCSACRGASALTSPLSLPAPAGTAAQPCTGPGLGRQSPRLWAVLSVSGCFGPSFSSYPSSTRWNNCLASSYRPRSR
jgi:hypothetical protein